jgi:hypothetical protein
MMSPAFPDWRGWVLWGSVVHLAIAAYDRRQREPTDTLRRQAGRVGRVTSRGSERTLRRVTTVGRSERKEQPVGCG